jgi:thioredoxin-related protein
MSTKIEQFVSYYQTKLQDMSRSDFITMIGIVIVVVFVILFIIYDRGTRYTYSSPGMEGFVANESESESESEYSVLNSMNEFASFQGSNANVHALLIYDENCGHCSRFKSTWLSLQNKAPSNIKFFAVGNNEDELRQEISTKFNVEGYPTVLIIKKSDKNVYEYMGARSEDAIMAELQN